MEFTTSKVISIVWQNGAGKSTLMNVLGRVKQKNSGKTIWSYQRSPGDSPSKFSYYADDVTMNGSRKPIPIAAWH